MAKLFDSIRVRQPRLNKFDLSREFKASLNQAFLYPVLTEEVLPGDRFRVNTEIFLRLAPMLAPVMHRINVYVHYFFVPNRLIWDEWEDFITGGSDGTAAPVFPHVDLGDFTAPAQLNQYFANRTLADYLGVPDMSADRLAAGAAAVDTLMSVLPFRAYSLIFNEYYRDQNLDTELVIDKTSGKMTPEEFNEIGELRRRAWEKDYFTSALPWAQRGAAVGVPLEGVGSVTYLDTSLVKKSSDGSAVGNNMNIGTGNLDGDDLWAGSPTPADGEAARIENIDEVTVDNVDFTINALRRAVRLQEWLEKNARGGARYVEQILSHFGVVSSDARLQRPEYLGGGRSPVVISEVLQTSEDGTTPQGNMAGHGMSAGNSQGFRRRFEEHGYVMGILSILPRTAYQDGLKRMFSRASKFDYYWPEFANLGEQEILNKEVAWQGIPGTDQEADEGTWGYQSRYAEYKYGCSTVHGDFRDSLSYWAMQRIFQDAAPPGNRLLPPLNADFVRADPTYRIFAVEDTTVDHFYCQIFHKFDALRPMPYYGTPSL